MGPCRVYHFRLENLTSLSINQLKKFWKDVRMSIGLVAIDPKKSNLFIVLACILTRTASSYIQEL